MNTFCGCRLVFMGKCACPSKNLDHFDLVGIACDMSRGLGQVLGDLMLIFGVELPEWGGLALGVIMGLLFLPFFLKNHKSSKARKILKKSSLEAYEARRDHELEAISLVAHSPHGLIALCDEAMVQGRYALAKEILLSLPKEKKWQKERRKRLSKMSPSQDLDPMSALLSVERFLQEGMTQMAVDKLSVALKKWPTDKGLNELKSKIESET